MPFAFASLRSYIFIDFKQKCLLLSFAYRIGLVRVVIWLYIHIGLVSAIGRAMIHLECCMVDVSNIWTKRIKKQACQLVKY